MTYSVERILEKWGNCWGRDRIGTEYPSVTPSIPVLPSAPRKAWLKHLSDDECLKIEGAIMALHRVDLAAYQVTMALYVQQLGEEDIHARWQFPRLKCIACVIVVSVFYKEPFLC